MHAYNHALQALTLYSLYKGLLTHPDFGFAATNRPRFDGAGLGVAGQDLTDTAV